MNNRSNTLILFIALSFMIGCGNNKEDSSKQKSKEEPSVDYSKYPEPLSKALQAHGGLDTWKDYKSLDFDKITEEGREHHLIDLEKRKVLIITEDYQLGFNGEKIWVNPDKESFPGSSPRFYHNLWFYFYAFPFIVTDLGANQKSIGTETFNGEKYEKVLVTYNNGVGDSPEDQYILYINKENNQLDFINYSVTYFDESKATDYNVLVYDEWKKVGNLILPVALTGYKWENDTIGDERYKMTFDNIRLRTVKPDQDLFEIPDQAYVE